MSRLIIYLFCSAFATIIIDGKIILRRDSNDAQDVEFENDLFMFDNNIIDVSQFPDSDVAQKKCAEVGEYCDTNSDCCSNLCLGFMKRCVSGSKHTVVTLFNKINNDNIM